MGANRLLTVLAGIAAGVAAAACATHQVGAMRVSDVEAPISIREDIADSRCVVTSKEASIKAYKNQKLKLKFSNYCETDVTVSVGNFRTEQTMPSLPVDCSKPYVDPSKPIFRETDADDFDDDIDMGEPDSPRTGRVDLKLRTRDELGPDRLTYYYDICIDGRIQKDPRLIIEP